MFLLLNSFTAADQDNHNHIFLPRNTVYIHEDTPNLQTTVIHEQFSQVNTNITSAIRENGHTSWYHNGQRIAKNGERYNSSIIISNDNESLTLSLEIVNATSDDVGFYMGTVVVEPILLYRRVDNQRRCYSYYDFADLYLNVYYFVTVYMVASVETYSE